jgi:nucleoside phosphorylase
MPDEGYKPRCVVILTAIPVEYQAVRAHLTDLHEETHLSGTVYERGYFASESQSWDVVIGEIGPRNPRAALETERAISHFKPILAFFVGIAGGLKDVTFGDVVAATQAYAYGSGKAKKTLETRPIMGNSAYSLIQRSKAEARKREWLKRIKGVSTVPEPRVFVAPIASGDRVVASTNSSDWKILRSKYSDALAVDMEGYGFLDAAHDNKVDALVVRGISDLVDNKSDEFHDVAARHASAFTFEILARLDVSELQQDEQESKTSAPLIEQRGEATQHEIAAEEKPEILSPKSITEGLLLRFCTELSSYAERVEKIRDFFGEEGNLSPNQCKSAIKWLDILDECVQKLRKDAPALEPLDSVVLVDIHNKISALKSELQTFRRPRWFIKTSRFRQGEENAHEQIRTICEDLLNDLERFKR